MIDFFLLWWQQSDSTMQPHSGRRTISHLHALHICKFVYDKKIKFRITISCSKAYFY